MEVTNPKQQIKEEGITVALTHAELAAELAINAVRSPKAGAIVLFAGEHREQRISSARLSRL